ncbi:DUF4065 domain-containing protein [Sphingobium sp. PNB]|uniref:Panacea domain-containing protein n=1 Tax=Sphingobium sp. PNB TaxID=863934 RepID=UPI001CA427F9|nr:type II toxin-antitoxin system antitoxin SocA domain-containing protein [Sphingobium sp. PNB]MCB4860761.1 DUF4065 domain-containing protein [Sphingobium sp. PNB]
MSVLIAARTLGEESGWKLSPLEYQKILYVAQMIHLGREKRPLFEENFEAWDHGPVVPALYHELKSFNRGFVTSIAVASTFAFGTSEAFAIDDAFTMTLHMSAGQLVNYTHRPGGAWEKYYDPGARGATIPPSAILEEWKECSRPSAQTLSWAEQMAAEVEASPPRYLASEDERAFRARLRVDDSR